jgi:hypothetical protein
MATVYVGSARSGENGKIRGGKAGDQTKKEVVEQPFYTHALGWNGIEAKDPVVLAKIAVGMKAACNNQRIGYDQGQRDTLYAAAKAVGFDLAKVNVDTETDCSALVRVILASAGIMIPAWPRFSTASMLSVLKATGKFNIITNVKRDYLKAGTILVTKKTGHTVVVLNNGALAGVPWKFDPNDVPWLRYGDSGDAVVYMKKLLNKHHPKLPLNTNSPIFNLAARARLIWFQARMKIERDAICGPETWSKLLGVLCK